MLEEQTRYFSDSDKAAALQLITVILDSHYVLMGGTKIAILYSKMAKYQKWQNCKSFLHTKHHSIMLPIPPIPKCY